MMHYPRFFPLSALCWIVLFAVAARADFPFNLPSGGVTLLVPSDFSISGNPSVVSLKREGTDLRKGQLVWRADTTEAAAQPWDAQLKALVKTPVKKGDVCLVLLEVRAVATSNESQQARFRLVVADRAKPFPRISLGGFSLDETWREVALPFVFDRDHAPGEVEVSCDLGYGRQGIELAGLRVIDFGGSVSVNELPRTHSTYAGEEPGAAWRAEALARIDRIRRGELALRVTDAAGKPVPGARVRADEKVGAFQFGTAVNDGLLLAAGPDADQYRRHILELFNAATLENALKWPNWIGEGKPSGYHQRTLDALAWLHDHGLSIRGHVMVWPAWRFLPESVNALRDQPEAIPSLVTRHIRDIALATRDTVSEWDVLNEPVSHHDLMDLCGREIMVDWYKTAAAALPGVPLYLNDWGNHDWRESPKTVAAFTDVVRYLRDHGAPLGGLGLQCHIGGLLSDPRDILATLDDYQKEFSLPIRITEFDVNTDDEQAQADYTRDFLIVAFSQPSVVGVQLWGFWAGSDWQPQCALYRKDWTEKPNGAVFRKLVTETWHTDAGGVTDTDGRWRTSGFYGRYDVTVTVGEKVFHTTVEHLAGGQGDIAVKLPASF